VSHERSPPGADRHAAPLELDRIAALVEEVSGIVFPHGQLGFLRDLMARRAAQTGLPSFAAYLALLERGQLEDEWRHLLPAITVKESFLFRVPEQFRALREELLPRLAEARGGAPLRLWSAGCANGEEPATLAVVLAESGLPLSGWRILATDVDERALQVAQAGVFSQRAVSQVPPDLLERWFEHRGDRWILAPELRAQIDFRRVNLVREPFPELGGKFDVILLRNVLIYFRPESQSRVVGAVADSLAADGYLFLGHSESLWQLTDRLGAVDLGGCFVYRHQVPASGAGESARAPSPRRTSDRRGRDAASIGRPAGTGTEGGRAGERRVSGVGRTTVPKRGAPVAVPAAPPPGGDATPPTLEAAAAALRSNRVDTAATLVAARLTAAPEDPGAHALQGLVHDLRQDADAAMTSYRAALFLAPGLYQIRLLLADALRRAGWAERARAEYRRVLGELETGGVELPALAAFLVPDRTTAAARCRAALGRL
jgi:chemotaxis protein methyltransferase CheR